MTAAPRTLESTLRAFADRLFVTGGHDPGDAALALPPARLALYRSLLLGNYRAMLRYALTQSFALMKAQDEDTDAILARFLEVSPARTHSSREMADRFIAFLPVAYPALVARRPDLADLMALERAELRAMFEADDPGRGLAPEDVLALTKGSLDDLLAMTIVRAPSASVLRLAHPVVDLRSALERRETAPAAKAGAECVTVSRGRAPRFAIEICAHSAETALVFETAVPGVPMSAESLAMDWFDALPAPSAARDEEWKASTFAAAVLTGLRSGLFRAN